MWPKAPPDPSHHLGNSRASLARLFAGRMASWQSTHERTVRVRASMSTFAASSSHAGTARAGNRRFKWLSALRAHTKPP